jgi:hypothetical protein
MLALSKGSNRRRLAVVVAQQQQRSFLATSPKLNAEEESCMMLILGKPGGGKGTISGKILKVRSVVWKLGYVWVIVRVQFW